MMAIDLVADKQTKEGLPLSAQAGETVFKHCVDLGVIVRPVGDRIVLSPPIIMTEAQGVEIINALEQAIMRFAEG